MSERRSGRNLKRRLYGKGRRYEIKLAYELQKRGLAVQRGPASGAGSRKLMYVDLVAFWTSSTGEKRCLALEVKYSAKRDTVYLNDVQLEALRYWNSKGAEAYVAVKYANQPWKFVPVELVEVRESDDGRIGRVGTGLYDLGFTLDEVIEKSKDELMRMRGWKA